MLDDVPKTQQENKSPTRSNLFRAYLANRVYVWDVKRLLLAPQYQQWAKHFALGEAQTRMMYYKSKCDGNKDSKRDGNKDVDDTALQAELMEDVFGTKAQMFASLVQQYHNTGHIPHAEVPALWMATEAFETEVFAIQFLVSALGRSHTKG
eukprot:Filipodium_phascolosomae@DN1776_c0_g1_i1.p2